MDKLKSVIRTSQDTVSATFEDEAGFTCGIHVSSEDLVKMVNALEDGEMRSRFSNAVQPDAATLETAGKFLLGLGYTKLGVAQMQGWSRVWTAESHGWKRN